MLPLGKLVPARVKAAVDTWQLGYAVRATAGMQDSEKASSREAMFPVAAEDKQRG